MKGFIVASLWLVLTTSVALGSPVGSCSTFSGSGSITFLRDDRNCSVFYECVSTEPTMVVCPSGLHFNAVLKVCDWPAAAGCSVTTPAPVKSTVFTRATPKPEATPDKAEPPGAQTVIFTREPSSTVPAPVDVVPVKPQESTECPAVGGCPKYNGDDTLVIQLPHAFNCSRFCMCDHGKPVTFECPSGLHYNKAEGICDWPVNAKCVPDRGFAGMWSPPEPDVPAESSRRRRSWNLLRFP
ncbi:probable chitinase 10 [Schistocerca nitens]|uniref:probable chitinase 10 n=1 Tax=Schistocerca nitens TaxID=7011 RepID=UPI00211764E4|nr:probable chitinase 10 [Schistocerca nitens]